MSNLPAGLASNRPVASVQSACPARLSITARVKVPCARKVHTDQPRVRHYALLVGDPIVSWMTDEHHQVIDVRWAPHAAEFAGPVPA